MVVHSALEMQQSFSKVALLSEDWPSAAAKEEEKERGAVGRGLPHHALSLLSGRGKEHI